MLGFTIDYLLDYWADAAFYGARSPDCDWGRPARDLIVHAVEQ